MDRPRRFPTCGTEPWRTGTVSGVETDILGAPYERHTIDLGTDDEGPVVATLVRRGAERTSDRAVLHLHGYNDYFFHTHLADFYAGQGYDFYALELRKYGRSLLGHQTPNYAGSMTEYFPELDEAARIIREQDGHTRLVVDAHSTGGLIAALWAHRMRERSIVDGMFLNSPFVEFNLAAATRYTAGPALAALGRVRPYAKAPGGVADAYGLSIHADHHGEWTFDQAWKPVVGFAPRLGWVNAIRGAQARLHAGLDIAVPILVGCSLRSYKRPAWTEAAQTADSVLDVDHIARWAPALGRHVTLIRFDGALHDLTLSAPPVRERVFAELATWLHAYQP